MASALPDAVLLIASRRSRTSPRSSVVASLPILAGSRVVSCAGLASSARPCSVTATNAIGGVASGARRSSIATPANAIGCAGCIQPSGTVSVTVSGPSEAPAIVVQVDPESRTSGSWMRRAAVAPLSVPRN